MKTEIDRMKKAMLDQENRATAHPMYLVQEQRPFAGKSIWAFVDVFFTEEAAGEFIARHRRNFLELRVYVGSGWRNPEWKAVRELLIGDNRDN